MSQRAELVWLVTAFALLWIPFGQHGFLFEHWMKVGVFIAPFLIFVALAFRSDSPSRSWPDPQTLSLILLIAYIVHQFEEHWIDIYGNQYAFKPYLNSMLLERFGVNENGAEPLSDAGVFVINTSLVWLVGALAIWRAPHQIFPALCMAAIVCVNAVSHLGAALVGGAYNPGLLTAVIVFLPLGIGTYLWLLRSASATIYGIAMSLLWGIFAHVIMIVGMLASGLFQILPALVYFIMLVAWSTIPTLVFRRLK